jgi:hypothetical protein
VGDHQAVVGKDAGTVRHQQHGAVGGDLLDARDIHPPVVATQVLEHRTRVANGLLIQSEIVHVTGALAHPQGRRAAPHPFDDRHPVPGTPPCRLAGCSPRIEARAHLPAQIEKGGREEIAGLASRIFAALRGSPHGAGLVGRVDVGAFTHLPEPQR